MKAISRAITMTLGAGILSAIFVSSAMAGCGDPSDLKGGLQLAAPSAVLRAFTRSAQPDSIADRFGGGGSSASIVGLWKTQLISKGNGSHNPPIPDGALIDFGYTQWHSDGTEILNSAGHPSNTGSFCLGVWGQTGFLTYELNHFPISFDPTTGAITGFINIREQDTLSPSGNVYTGTFTLDVYDPKGNHVDHLVGTVLATRLTVDSTLPSSIPSNQ
ncbi:MAG TPA: hypothetical protein VFW44_04795 [Bryobacteraceae bacterium]|nr:hypothetical protein [Bryobacteraceae bacterium]